MIEQLNNYTGLTSWKLFEYLHKFLKSHRSNVNSKILQADILLMTLMRLRLNLQVQDLAYRFGMVLSTASYAIQKCINIMFSCLQFLIKWPSKDIVRTNMPQVFKDLYPRIRCIIDCSEIFIERPQSFEARAQTYSNYKKHNTAKFLIAITPNGAISFLSKCWGGRATDKLITQNSGFLDLIEHAWRCYTGR